MRQLSRRQRRKKTPAADGREKLRHILNDGNDRDGCLVGLGKACDQQGRGRSVLSGYHCHLVRDAGIGIRHYRTCVFRAVSDLPDTVLGGCEEQGGRNGWAVVENPGTIPFDDASGDPKPAVDQALADSGLQIRTSRDEILERLLESKNRSQSAG